jgi:3-hydroxyacyl-CoA dehydrogenase/enoyl-CoA hydratase/3-hydroxybutyryl-CoA epimerase
VRLGVQQGMEAGLAYEREAIGRLVTTPACRNLVNLFLQREQAKKPQPDGHRNGPSLIRRVGVVGLGTMGAGIAQLAALKGCEVVVREVNEGALGMGLIRVLALFRQAVERGLVSAEEYEKKLAAIHGTTAWKGFEGVELVVEAIVEDLEAKRRLFRELERHTAPSTILATNTSSLKVEQLQEGLEHPGRVAGLHFFNPVHKMPLVEVVRAPQTRDGVVNRLVTWAGHLDKTPVVVKDSPGFLVNRILMPYLNEAILLLGEGMRTELVDEAMRRFGMPLGPLELLDQVGLDVAAHIARAMQSVFGQRFAITPAFEQMQGRGWLGQKSKQGFYRYRGSRKKVHQAALDLIRRESQAAAPYSKEALPPEEQKREARARMVGLMVNEAAACLQEGIVEDAATLDLAMVLGASWAPHRGGPMRYAQDQGIGTIVKSLEELARRLGPRFEPCAELRRRVLV